MPVPQLAKLARRYGTSLRTVEGYWDACKNAIKPTKGPRNGWGVVSKCVQAKLRKLKAQRRPK